MSGMFFPAFCTLQDDIASTRLNMHLLPVQNYAAKNESYNTRKHSGNVSIEQIHLFRLFKAWWRIYQEYSLPHDGRRVIFAFSFYFLFPVTISIQWNSFSFSIQRMLKELRGIYIVSIVSVSKYF